MIAGFNKKQKTEISANEIAFQIAVVILLVIIVVLMIANVKMFQKKKGLASQVSNYQRQIEDIKQSSKTLEDKIANADNVDYLETLAYEQGMIRVGEKEVVFIAPDEKEKAEAKANNFWSKETWTSWIGDTWQWIKNRF